MAVEIERKFLIASDEWRTQAQRSQRLVQGYLTPGRSPSASEAMDGRERPPGRSPSASEAMDGRERPPGRSPSAPKAMDGREGPAEATHRRDRPQSGNGAPPCSVRIRIGGDSAWLNIKSALAGIERREYEYAIPPGDAELMLKEFCATVVEKVRHYVPYAGAMFEVDEFLGDNAGLVVAELEMRAATDEFPRPAWLGREVSDQPRYYNLHLLDHPYSHWSARERAGD
jgi:adenylate cyclase